MYICDYDRGVIFVYSIVEILSVLGRYGRWYFEEYAVYAVSGGVTVGRKGWGTVRR